MRNLTTTIVAGFAAMTLGACAMGGAQLDEAQSMTPKGSTFGMNLHKGYTDLALSEYAEWDEEDGTVFATRAVTAGKGNLVLPEEISTRKLPKGSVGDLTAARARLVDALRRGAGRKAPEQAARAQVMFDCWMQEQEENDQPRDIKACRDGYEAAMGPVLASLKEAPKVAAKPAPKPAPMPKKIAPPSALLVLFDLDSSKLTGNAPNQINHAAALASGKDQLFTIHLAGHTDLAGDSKYNLVLSKARVDAVAQALIKAGVPANRITKEIHGEEKPRVMTADGTAEQANRRVEAIFRK